MEAVGPGTRELRVGAFWIRPLHNEFDNGEQRSHLEARSIEVLLCLARHAPSVVSKDTILDEVWGDQAVGDEVVSHAVWELRKSFGDDARRQEYIRTIPKKGYALVAEVFWSVDGAEPQAGTAVGRYKLEEEIGRGAMGVVFRAVDTRLQRPVAVKFLAADLTRDTEAVRRFEREARLAAALDHPNLAPVYEVGEMSGGRQFLVTAYCAGGTLRDRLSHSTLPPREAVRIVAEVARGLAVAHRKDIVHRDVKPGNILFTDDGTARLVDFGIAKLSSSVSLTRTGHSLGTPAYKSPEQSRGDPTDHRTDIWSLGVVLYESLTGKRPFGGSYEHAVVRAILEDEPDLTLSLPADRTLPGLEQILREMLAKEPDDRYESAEELADDLEALLDGTQGTMPRVRQRGWWAAGGMLLLLGAAGAAMLVSQRGAEPVMPETDAWVQQKVDEYLAEGWQATMEGLGPEGTRTAREKFGEARERRPKDPEVIGSYVYSLTLSVRDPQEDESARAKARRLLDEARSAGLEHGLMLVAESRLEMVAEKARLRELAAAGEELPAAKDRYIRAIRFAKLAIDEFGRENDEPDHEDTNSDLGYITLGRACELAEQTDTAVDAYEAARTRGRGAVRAGLSLAYLYWQKKGKWERAADIYKEILEEDEDNYSAKVNLGAIYTEAGMWPEAERYSNSAVEQRPTAAGYTNLGSLSFYRGNVEDACRYYRRALEYNPRLASARSGLGDCLAKTATKAEAAAEWSRALDDYQLDSGRVEQASRRRAERAVTLAKLGRCPEALAEPVLQELDQVGADSILNYAQVHALCGERSEVYAAVSRVVAGGRVPMTLFEIDPSFESFQDDPKFKAALGGN